MTIWRRAPYESTEFVVNFAPEYEDCARLAREKNVPLKRIQSEAVAAYMKRG